MLIFSGVIVKVVPVGADGVEGTAATLGFDLASAGIADLAAVSTENGELTVSWTRTNVSGDVKVNVKSVNTLMGAPVNVTLTATGGASFVVFADMPVCGDDFIVTAWIDGKDAVSLSGNFIDIVCDSYAEDWSWSGNILNLPMPTTRDWRYLYVYQDGVAKTFATTYNQGNKPMIIRGRSTWTSLSFSSTAKNVSVVIEDYKGNLSAPLFLRSDDVTDLVFPDPIFRQWVLDNVGTMMGDVESYTGTLALAGLEISDFTGLEKFTHATALDVSGSRIASFDIARLSSSIVSVDFSNNENLIVLSLKYLADGLILNLSGCTNLLEIDLTGTTLSTFDITPFTKLTHFVAKNSSLETLSTAKVSAYADVEVFDISGSKFDLADGTFERSLVDTFDGSVYNNQRPVVHLEELIDSANVPDDGAVIRTMDYYEAQYKNATTGRGTKIADILDADWIASDYDLAKAVAVPEKVYVEIYNSAGTLVNPADDGNTVPTVDTDTNVALNATVLSYSAQNSGEPATKMFDGTVENNSKWCTSGQTGWVAFSLEEELTIGQWVAYHAEQGGESASYNTRNFVLQVFNPEAAGMTEDEIIASKTKSVLQNNANWTTISTVTDNTLGTTVIGMGDAPEAKVYRLQIINSIQGTSNAAVRIYELELFPMNSVARDTDGFFTADTEDAYTVNFMKGKAEVGTVQLNVVNVALESMTLNKSVYALLKSKTATLSVASFSPIDANFDIADAVWTSSDPTIVLLTGARPGQIKALKEGTTTITCTIGDVSTSCEVTVATAEVTSFALNEEVLKVKAGDAFQLGFADVLPANATNLNAAKWFSSNSSFVTVSATGELQFVAKGYATITCQIGPLKVYCKVYVI